MTTETKSTSKRPYLRIFVTLAALTAVEVVLAGLIQAQTLRVIALLGLAVVKAALVALYFMHLRYDNRLLAVVGGVPMVLTLFMLILLLMDRTMM
jgi:cytochrome c oxidase subunit 4